jgi:hypothetical protein
LNACATTAPTSQSSKLDQVGLGQSARLAALEVTPGNVVEDSRCPTGVQCIQAGTVRIAALIRDRAGYRSAVLVLGTPLQLDGGWASLIQVCPYPRYGSRIAPASYRFTIFLATEETPLVDAPGCPRR